MKKFISIVLFMVAFGVKSQNATQAQQIIGNGYLRSIDNSLSSGTTTFVSSATTRTVSALTATATGTVSSGYRAVTFSTSAAFTGSIAGGAVSPNSVYSFGVSQNNDNLGSIIYTISGGTLTAWLIQ